MADLALAAMALTMLVLKGAFTLLLVYVGARLAIRHERALRADAEAVELP